MLLRKCSLDELIDVILDNTPVQTKLVIGRESIDVWDVLDLPRWDMASRKWSTYMEVAQLKVNGKAPAGPFAQHVLYQDGKQFDMGVYVGSGTQKNEGVSTRITYHRHRSQVGYQRVRPGTHYDVSGRHGVHSDFFALCVLPDPVDMKGYASLMEGAYMAFFNVMDFLAATQQLYELSSSDGHHGDTGGSHVEPTKLRRTGPERGLVSHPGLFSAGETCCNCGEMRSPQYMGTHPFRLRSFVRVSWR